MAKKQCFKLMYGYTVVLEKTFYATDKDDANAKALEFDDNWQLLPKFKPQRGTNIVGIDADDNIWDIEEVAGVKK